MGQGIALPPVDPDANDAGDVDGGPNSGQNYPLITSVDATVIEGTLSSNPDTPFRVEFSPPGKLTSPAPWKARRSSVSLKS